MFAISYPGLPKKKFEFLRPRAYILFAILPLALWSQGETELFLVNLSETPATGITHNFQNLSRNKGYDNQPSFYDENLVLFSSTRNGQTDVAAYDLVDGALTWKTNTPGGGEYSPLRIPGSKDFSAIRLDVDGKQLLYRYNWKTGSSKPLVGELKVGYHLWHSPEVLISAVLVDGRMDLVVSNLKDHTNYTFQRNVGRSLHRIPNTQLVSFINKENDRWELKSMDPVSGATEVITYLPPGVEDVCWLSNGVVLAGKGNRILQYRPGTAEGWTFFREFPTTAIGKISRMSTHSSSDILLMVAEVPQMKSDRP